MARRISRLVLVAACVTGLAGCGSGVGDPSAGRCPQAAPYLANDGYCYGSANEAVAYARCEEAGFTAADFDATAQYMVAGIEQFGYSRLELLDIYFGSCERGCGSVNPNDVGCVVRCRNCIAGIVAFLFDG